MLYQEGRAAFFFGSLGEGRLRLEENRDKSNEGPGTKAERRLSVCEGLC